MNTPVIAIVDDDPAMREALTEFFQAIGMASRSFDGASALLKDYAPGRFDCLISDVRMPDLDGLALQQRLRGLGSDMPVIFITAAPDSATRARALDGGAWAYLSKPVAEDILLDHVRSALRRAGPVGEQGADDGKPPGG
ncbi:response regulator [Emcibacter sp. SYSU 3D8]|uniref:response regulator transcription factor n=1 Tax=Emcibacter sp. SYSU 3D8 TaxID=3133969 RepID=UPI0031FF2C45